MKTAPYPETAPLFSRWAARLLLVVNVASLFFMGDVLAAVFAYTLSNPLAIIFAVGITGTFVLVILPGLYGPIRDFVIRVGDYSHYLLAGGAALTIVGMAAGGGRDLGFLLLAGMFARNTVVAELALAGLILVSGALRKILGRSGGRGDIYEP